jgi:hypothetical protein
VLETLWDTAHECGNPVIGTADDVEAAAEWWGEPGRLFEALREGRWIDELPDGRWQIHDYWDHCPEYVRARFRMERFRKKQRESLAQFAAEEQCNEQERNGYVTVTKRYGSPAPAPAPAPLDSPNGESGSEPQAASEPATADRNCTECDSSSVILVYPTVGKGPKEWALSAAKLAEYTECYPGTDVLGECRKALQWCRDNPTRRKTAKGMPAFLVRWLNQAQDKSSGGRVSGGNGRSGKTQPHYRYVETPDGGASE